jgi:hypothetical protein
MKALISIVRIVVLVAGFVAFATSAEAVTAKKNGNQTEMGWVTTGAATRAHSDVQLRRLLSVFAEKNNDVSQDELFDQIQKLRRVKKGGAKR